MVWVWLYRVWPRCLETMVLVKPATVVQWHRQGFRLYCARGPGEDRYLVKLAN
jgi:putative transposase